MKKLASLCLAAILILGALAGCGSTGGAESGSPAAAVEPAATPETSAPAKPSGDKVFKIGVTQFVEHPALDLSYKGFVDGLAEAGYVEGTNVKIDYQNAQGEQANCSTIAEKLVNAQNDLILAIATPAAQAVANATTEIPILVTAVTDPVSAALVTSNEAPGGNVSGTSDRTPCAEQMELLTRLLPEAKTVALLYCSAESNSKYQAEMAREAAVRLGLETKDFTVSNSNEIQQVVESMIGKVDAIYAPTDNMISAGMATVSMVATENKIPIICGEEGMLENGGLATYGLSYYELGKLTATQAVKIFEGASPADMPIGYLTSFELSVNQGAADQLGITIPSDLS